MLEKVESLLFVTNKVVTVKIKRNYLFKKTEEVKK